MSFKVSIVIPTHNDAKTLPSTLASVFAQDLAADEVIIINDGGSEDPAVYLGEMADRVRVISLEKNGGVSAARNIGLAESTGDVILLLDSDDIISPDFLRLGCKALADYPDAAFCIADAIRCPDDQMDAMVPEMESGRDSVDVKFYPQDEMFDHVVDNSGFYLPSFALMRRSHVELSEGGDFYDARLINGSDFQMFLRASMRHGGVMINDNMGLHRLRPGSLSKNKPRAWTCRYQSMDMLLSEDPVLGQNPRYREAIASLRSSGARRAARLLRADGRRKEALQVMREDLGKQFSAKSAYCMLRLLV